MNFSLFVLLEAVLFALALAIDALIASIAYGSKKIKLPLQSAVVLNLICGIILGASLLLGSRLQQYIPATVTMWISFAILFLMGLSKLLDGGTKALIVRYQKLSKKSQAGTPDPFLSLYETDEEKSVGSVQQAKFPPLIKLRFSFFHLKFILHLYANPIEADVDRSKIISPIEALSLGIALSLDGLAVGFGAGVAGGNLKLLFSLAILSNIFAIWLGFLIGNKLAHRLRFNVAWISGGLLVLLAFSKLW